jgi:hypothetical protein
MGQKFLRNLQNCNEFVFWNHDFFLANISKFFWRDLWTFWAQNKIIVS